MNSVQTAASEHGRTRHYRDLLVWQKAMVLARAVYALSEKLPRSEVFALQLQLRRSAVSVPSNIAEGHGRLNDGYFRQFLGNARGSLFELQTQLELAAGLYQLDQDATAEAMALSEEVARLLNGLLAKLES